MEFNTEVNEIDLELEIAPVSVEITDTGVSESMCVDVSDTFTFEDNEPLGDMLIYPCIVINGLSTEAELDFFTNAGKVATAKSLPLFILFSNIHKRLTTFSLDLKNLLLVRTIADYEIWIYKSDTNKVRVDLNDAEMLTKFISL